MSSLETSSTPKNCITSGISKSLLTPCRRVGLSRSKKTPKNNSPQISASQEGITPTPTNAKNSINLKNQSVVLAKSEQGLKGQSLNTKSNGKKHRKTLSHCDIPIENEHGSTEIPGKTPNLPRQVARQANLNRDSFLPNIVPLDTPPSKLQSNENTDLLETPKIDEQVTCEVLHAQSFETSAEERIMTETQCSESNSPSSSIIHTVTAQIHHPTTKRNLDFSEYHRHHNTRTENSKVDSCSESNAESSEKYIVKSLKRKFDLSNDDFGTDNDIFEDTQLKNKKSNFNQSTTSLARFNTEDYLSEYSTPNNDVLIDFMPSEKLKYKSTDDNEKKDGKNYVGIFCPSITKSEIDNSVKQPFNTRDKVLSNKMLTVNLESLNKNLKKQSKKSHSDEMPCTENNKKSNSKNTFENSSDEEFTSSPQSDKNRRENLLQLIAQIQREIRSKKESLERLQQAQVYQKIHSPKKLNESSERWTEVCKIALGDLLTKTREFEPMEMDNLLIKLKIPDHIIVKLKL